MAHPVEQLATLPPRPDLTNKAIFEDLMDQGRDPMLMTKNMRIISNEAYSTDSNVSILIPPGEGGELIEFTVSLEEAAQIDNVRREIIASRSTPVQ